MLIIGRCIQNDDVDQLTAPLLASALKTVNVIHSQFKLCLGRALIKLRVIYN